MALSPASLVPNSTIPSRSLAQLLALAPLHSLWRRGCRTTGRGCRALRPMGSSALSSRRALVPPAHLVKAQAYALGFDLAGIAPLGPMNTADAYESWIARGFAGEMHYLQRGAAKRRDSRSLVQGARTAIVVGLDYGGRQPGGRVARYARGRDYHHVMERRLRELGRWLEATCGRPVVGKAYVDTGPLLERELAQRAGLGWIGKNTNLINPRTGSFFLIGALLVDLELVPDPPFDRDRCGRCQRCLEACPTDAFVAPRVLDSRRCISYLTIELRGAIPHDLRPHMGELVFGCDICQEVCPWNVRFAREPHDFELTRPDWVDPDPAELLSLNDVAFRERFQGTPLMRAGRRGLARNAAVALGNRRSAADLPVLIRALHTEPDALVRAHVAWALGRCGSEEARSALLGRLHVESDPTVRNEILAALAETRA